MEDWCADVAFGTLYFWPADPTSSAFRDAGHAPRASRELDFSKPVRKIITMVPAFPAPKSEQLLRKAEDRFRVSINGPVDPSWNHHWPFISNFDGWRQKVATVGCHDLGCGWKFVGSLRGDYRRL